MELANKVNGLTSYSRINKFVVNGIVNQEDESSIQLAMKIRVDNAVGVPLTEKKIEAAYRLPLRKIQKHGNFATHYETGKPTKKI